jgi:hypothetical protein
VARGLGYQDLTAVRGCLDPGGEVQVKPDQAPHAAADAPCMDTHPNPKPAGLVRPLVSGQGALRVDRGLNRLNGINEQCEERIAGGALDVTTTANDRGLQQSVMVIDHVRAPDASIPRCR